MTAAEARMAVHRAYQALPKGDRRAFLAEVTGGAGKYTFPREKPFGRVQYILYCLVQALDTPTHHEKLRQAYMASGRHASSRQIREALARLVRSGYISRTAKGTFAPARYSSFDRSNLLQDQVRKKLEGESFRSVEWVARELSFHQEQVRNGLKELRKTHIVESKYIEESCVHVFRVAGKKTLDHDKP